MNYEDETWYTGRRLEDLQTLEIEKLEMLIRSPN